MAIIGIVLGVVAIGLFIWLRKQQQISDGLHAAELDHIHHGMNAIMDDFNNYQVKTDRKIAELEKVIKKNQLDQNRRMDKAQKELPSIIGRVVGQIEFAQDKINR
jgi:hypothetical protein|tara:strand:- start:795 stop:1109 length:315 start_codon:yes stop_codon:yes gene_type:complete